jgi:hypothetical protein
MPGMNSCPQTLSGFASEDVIVIPDMPKGVHVSIAAEWLALLARAMGVRVV